MALAYQAVQVSGRSNVLPLTTPTLIIAGLFLDVLLGWPATEWETGTELKMAEIWLMTAPEKGGGFPNWLAKWPDKWLDMQAAVKS